METFKEIKPEALDQSAFQLIGNDWMLVTAEAEGKINAMTASWGGLGVLWKKNVAYVVIRPQRYTKDLIDKAATFSLTFYEEGFRKTLSYLGTVSGRDEDKVAKSGLTLRHLEGTPYFEEARVVMRCKKLYAQELAPESFIDTQLMNEIYPTKDFHTLYIAEITQVFVKK
jgi:flavin reductase (DIM6/NTAB) family NADH-FMN oxidoreductase RutF